MEGLSSFVATVAPPPLQRGVEEARRTQSLRETIPQLNESESSAKNGVAGDNRGQTSGTNSQLFAQTSTLVQASTQQLRNEKTKQDKAEIGSVKKEEGKTEQVQNGSSQTSNTSATKQSVAASTYSTIGSFAGNAQIQASVKIHKDTLPDGAKFSKESTAKISSENSTRSEVIATRYNQSSYFYQTGGNINIAV